MRLDFFEMEAIAAYFSVDVKSPSRSLSIQGIQVFEFWPYDRHSIQNSKMSGSVRIRRQSNNLKSTRTRDLAKRIYLP